MEFSWEWTYERSFTAFRMTPMSHCHPESSGHPCPPYIHTIIPDSIGGLDYMGYLRERVTLVSCPVGKQARIARSQHKISQILHFHVVSGQKSRKIRPVTTYNMDGSLSLTYRSLSSDLLRSLHRAGQWSATMARSLFNCVTGSYTNALPLIQGSDYL